MDLKDSEKVEVEALRDRYNHLLRIYNDKKCGAHKQEIAPIVPDKKST